MQELCNQNSELFVCLRKIGLTNSEIAVYFASYLLGTPQTSGVLAKRSNLKQTTTIMNLKSLAKKGLISIVPKESYHCYTAEAPTALIKHLEARKQDIESLKKSVNEILPLLKSYTSPYITKPKIKVFEGVDNIKQLFLDMLDYGDEIIGYASINNEIDAPFDEFWIRYFQEVKKQKKHIRLIVPDTPEGGNFQKRDKKENRETILIPQKEFLFESEKHIVGNYIAHISMHPDSLVAIVIEDTRIASMERKFFELAWKSFKKTI